MPFNPETAKAARAIGRNGPAWRTRGIKEEHAIRIAKLCAQGMPMRFACAKETPPIALSAFQAALGARPTLAAIFDKTLADSIQPILDRIAEPDRSIKYLPAAVWALERSMPQYFGQPKAQTNVTINQTVVGIQDGVLKRAMAAVRRVAGGEHGLGSGAVPKNAVGVPKAKHNMKLAKTTPDQATSDTQQP